MDFIDHRSTAQFTFLTSATDEKIRINTSGDLLVGISTPFDTSGITLDATGALGVDGHITVATGATYDIGTATNKFRDLYLSGDINVAGVSTSGDLTVGGSLSVTTDATVTGSLTVNTDATITNDLTVSNDATVSGDLTVSTNAVIAGDLTVNGTTTTINTETLDVKDKNITLNYGGDTTSADGAGITIEDAVSAGTDATILWDGSTDTFDFSHAIDVTGTITGDNNLSIQNSSAYGSIEVGGVSGGFIDIKSPFSDDYDLRLIAEGDGGVINVASGELTIQRAGSAKLATTSTGIAVTGNATFADNGKAIFGAGSDLQIYHTGSQNYIEDAGTGNLNFKSNGNNFNFLDGSDNVVMQIDIDSETTLYHNTNAKLATTSTGVDVTGTVTTDGLTVATTQGNITIPTSTSSLNFDRAGSNYIRATDATGSFTFITGASDFTTQRLKLLSNGDVAFYEDTGTTEKFFWDASAERLGIGTTSPARDLHIVQNDDWAQVRLEGNSSGGAEIMMGDGTTESKGRIQYVNASNYMRFDTNQAERMRINSAGNVGIGTSSPAKTLHISAGVNASPTTFRIENTDTTIDTGQEANAIEFYTNDASTNGTGVSAKIAQVADNPGNQYDLAFSTYNTALAEAMRITNEGDVGIGTSSPTNKLHVLNAGTTAVSNAIANSGVIIDGGSGNAALNLISPDTSANYINFGDSTDSNNGRIIYNHNNNAMTFDTSASERMRIDSSGNVGIGTTSPNYLLDVESSGALFRINATSGDATAQLSVADTTSLNTINFGDSGSTTAGQILYRHNGDSMAFNVGGAEAIRILNGGNVGIGSTAPAAKLDIVDTSADVQMRVYKNDGTKNTRLTLTADDSGAKIHYRDADNAGALRFNNNLGEVMRIPANTTRLGIGTTNPDGTLHISGTGTAPAKLIWERSDGGVGSKNWTAYIDNTHDLLFGKTDDSGTLTHDYLHIEDGGNIGINTSSPEKRLHIFDSTQTNQTIRFGNPAATPLADINYDSSGFEHLYISVKGTTTGYGNIVFSTGPTPSEAMRLDASGNLVVGGSSAYAQGATTIANGGILYVSRSGGSPATFRRNSDDGILINLEKDGSTVGVIGTQGGDLNIGTGACGVQFVDGVPALYPWSTTSNATSDNAIDLGDSGARFKDLYLSGTAYAGTSIGIGTSSAESPLHIDYDGTAMRIVRGSAIGFLYNTGTATSSNFRIQSNGGGLDFYYGASGVVTFTDAGTERMRLDSSGNLLVGKTSLNDSLAGFQTSPSGDTRITRSGGAALVLNRKTSDGTILDIRKDGSTVGSIGVTNFDLTIQSSASGHNGLRFGNAWIAPIATNQALDDGTTDLGLQGARFKDLYLSGSAKLTSGNRSTDGKGGALIVGGNSDSNGLTTNTRKIGLITCPSYDNTDGNMALITGDTSSASTNYIYIGSAYTGYSSPTDIVFRTGSVGTIGSERTRIDSSGNQLWGKTSADNTTQGIRFLGSSGFMSVVRSNNTLAIFNRIDGDGTLLEFRTSGTTQGSISISGSTTSYNTTSDERLKQNIEDADDAGAIVDAIQVRKFDWIEGGEHQRYGMVAQELNTVAPEAVSVPDDAEEMQSVDYSKLVPMLVKEIQSLRARVAQLEGEN